MLFFSPSVFFVKEVSVLKRGRGGPLVCANHNMEEGVLQKEWSSVCEVAGRDAAQLDVHPPAACPINLQMQSIRQTADWLAPDSRKSYSHPKYGVSETGPLVSFWRSLASTWGRQIVFKKKKKNGDQAWESDCSAGPEPGFYKDWGQEPKYRI